MPRSSAPQVTLAERDGLGGACVLTDCVPSKALIEVPSTVTVLNGAPDLGIQLPGTAGGTRPRATADAERLYRRIKSLAQAQSRDVAARVAAEGVEVIDDIGRLTGPGRDLDAGGRDIAADAVLLATGAHPRVLPDPVPDGERILTWRELYDLTEFPEHLIVVGSGVTGAEFASALPVAGRPGHAGVQPDRVLPHEDADAAGGHRGGLHRAAA